MMKYDDEFKIISLPTFNDNLQCLFENLLKEPSSNLTYFLKCHLYFYVVADL